MKTSFIDEIEVINLKEIKNKLSFKQAKIDEFVQKGIFVAVQYKNNYFITKKSFGKFLGIKNINEANEWENFNKEAFRIQKNIINGKEKMTPFEEIRKG